MVLAFRIAESIIQITGDDRKAYLHGQVTQDLNLLDDYQFLWSGHCNAKGKLWSAHKLVKTDSSYLMVCGEEEAQQSLAELKKYGVFSKVEFELATHYTCVGLRADTTAEIETLLNIKFTENTLVKCEFGFALKLATGLVQLLVKDDKFATLNELVSIEQDENPWLAALIRAGLPRLNTATGDEFVPQMLNLQAINGISFTKGCYTGQETVARMKYLGKNKRAMYCLSGNAHSISDATDVEVKLGDNWRRAGKILNSAIDADTIYVQAILPNDIETDAVLRFKDHEGLDLAIQTLPYSLED